MRNIAVPLLVAIQAFAASGCGDKSITGSAGAQGCRDSATKTLASSKLADWLNQNAGKGNAYGVHGTFLAEMSASVEMGTLQGIHQCMANTTVGIKETNGSVLINPEILNMHFLVSAGQITLDEGQLLSEAARAADSLLVRVAMTASPSSAPAQAADMAPLEEGPKSYTFATCYKNVADAKRVAGPGGWHPGNIPCIQMMPAIHETKLGCLLKLAKFVKEDEGSFELDAPNARAYMRGESRDLWMQCVDAG